MAQQSEPAENVVLVGLLVDRCPPLLPVLQEHLNDNVALLSHPFMGDVTRWVINRYLDQPSDPELLNAFDLLEVEFARGRAQELIAASFLENLPHKHETGFAIRDQLGPQLTGHLSRP